MNKNVDWNKLEKLQEMHREQMKEKREEIKQRKARTRRLIVRGAMAENIVPNAENMSDELFQRELYRLVDKSGIAPSHPQDSNGSFPRKSPSEDTS